MRTSEEGVSSAESFEANASGDLDACEVRVSHIPGAGLGLFTTKLIKKGRRITKYSGTPISTKEARASKSKYLLYINSKKTLNAAVSIRNSYERRYNFWIAKQC